jgi:hypothetical protein
MRRVGHNWGRQYDDTAYIADGYTGDNRRYLAGVATAWRKDRRLSCDVVAQLSGMTAEQWRMIERADPDAPRYALARAVNLVLKLSPARTKPQRNYADVERNFRPESPLQRHPVGNGGEPVREAFDEDTGLAREMACSGTTNGSGNI